MNKGLWLHIRSRYLTSAPLTLREPGRIHPTRRIRAITGRRSRYWLPGVRPTPRDPPDPDPVHDNCQLSFYRRGQALIDTVMCEACMHHPLSPPNLTNPT